MKRMALIFGGVSLVAWGLGSALVACGGDDDATVADGDAGNASSTSSGSSSSGATSSSGGSTTSSSGGTGDGGGDASDAGDGASGDGGVTSNPNLITCGATECTAPTQVCCIGFGGDAGCIAANAGCGGGAKSECDEKADCTGGDICCFNAFNIGKCDNNCKGGGSYQTCKTNTECASGTCKVWTCAGNVKLRACESPFSGCQ